MFCERVKDKKTKALHLQSKGVFGLGLIVACYIYIFDNYCCLLYFNGLILNVFSWKSERERKHYGPVYCGF